MSRSHAEGVAPQLREDVRLLGDSLGDVLREQGGTELFDTVETIRQAAIAMRATTSSRFSPELIQSVTRLDVPSVTNVIRAFGTYFHLINAAEELQRLRRLRQRAEEASPQPAPGSIADPVRRIRGDQAAAARLTGLLGHLLVNPVFTAHPSEVRRRSVITHLIAIREQLSRLHGVGLDPWEAGSRRDA